MKPHLVILDADAVIHLNELGRWERVVEAYQLILPETVAFRECRYYENEAGCRIKINLKNFLNLERYRWKVLLLLK